jgi:ubiquinone/menaquinone biosynthesis C-methylase UbiE
MIVKMDAESLVLLRSPGSLSPLQRIEDELVGDSGERYEIRDDIPDLRSAAAHSGGWMRFYDGAAFGYDAALRFGAWLGLGSEAKVRTALLPNLAKPGEVVLDVGCGTAESRAYFQNGVGYIGLDISRGMLRQAARKCARRGLPATLVQAGADQLPVASTAISAAVAMGVFQHLHQPKAALKELLRVAKPGGRIYLIDETRALSGITTRCMGAALKRQDFCTYLARQHSLEIAEQGEMGEYFFVGMTSTHAL